jgi:hypothetical protein
MAANVRSHRERSSRESLPGGEAVRKIPAKSREFVEFLRAKFSAVTN